MHTYLVTYQLDGDDEVVTDEVDARDEACALGCVLDALDDESDGETPALVFVTIRRADVVLPLDALPKSVLNAWRAGLETS